MSGDRSASSSHEIKIRRIVDKLCDEIESKWVAGDSPDTVSIVNNMDPEVVPFFLKEIIQLEFDLQNTQFQTLRERYANILPDRSEIVDEIFDQLEHRVGFGITDMSTRLVDRTEPPIIEDYVGKKIGDYLVERKIGGGGFGIVYLGRDAYLPRNVVIKIPILGRLGDAAGIEEFLDEARHAVMLDHSNILSVLHVGVDSGLPYIVQEYLEGGDLDQALRERIFPVSETVGMIAKLAKAIGYAHESKIIHRDLKPSNILIDKQGEPLIADFGLSLREPQRRGREGEMVGTIRFMSPEQIRGEAHRLDGRTDIWSLGVVLYFMLVGEYPFDGTQTDAIGDAIRFGRPCPPRQLNGKISLELERICLKCLSVRVSDRYSTASDLADDLENILNPNSDQLETDSGSFQPLIPKGLSAFDSSDVDFFLDLLPGPTDRNGIPESVRFWKTRIEKPELSNPVSLLFGPSGCGKSSLVNAGLIPRLSEKITVIQVESTPHDTEVRFLKAVRAAVPSIPKNLSLPEICTAIRRGRYLPADRRLLVVFDQFEQWLHSNSIDEHSQLIHALRQCDGCRVQVMILVREDFWMAITRFFKALEIDLVERQNFASVDLFNRRHAKTVLTKFGQGYGILPNDLSKLSKSQDQFLDTAIDMLAENDAVICVRSALFAETVKNKPWEVDTLKHFGNVKNVGIEFLDQTLGEKSSNPIYRFNREQLIAILEALLPVKGVEIKGNLQSVAALAQATGLRENDSDFLTAIKILDNELRLITPTEPDIGLSECSSVDSYYQLTHDYLVPSIRDWVETERGRTIQGRSQQKLSELSLQWEMSADNRFLPGLFEYFSLVWNIPRRSITATGRKFLWTSTKYYGKRFLIICCLIAVTGMIFARQYMESVVHRAFNCRPVLLPSVINEMQFGNQLYASRIRQKIKNGLTEQKQRRALNVLAQLSTISPDEVQTLIDSVGETKDVESRNLFAGLANNSQQSKPLIEKSLRTSEPDQFYKLRIFSAFLSPQNSLSDILEISENPTTRSKFIHQFNTWQGDLSVCWDLLVAPRTEAELQGLCLMIGQIPAADFDPDDYKKIRDRISELYCTHPSSSIHGAARWALTNWNERLPKQDVEQSPSLEWHLSAMDMTMVFVPAGRIPNQNRGTYLADTIDDEYFISALEISEKVFAQFLADESVERPVGLQMIGKRPEYAVTGIAIEDAILFCNWLSIRCGLQPAYQKNETENLDHEIVDLLINVSVGNDFVEVISSIPKWELVEASDGYRLPSRKEWGMAARATKISIDNYFSDEMFGCHGDYMWMLSNSQNRVQPVGRKMPNPLGIFDILGNATELTCTQPSVSFFDSSRSSVLRRLGGSYNSGIASNKIGDVINVAAEGERPNFGFIPFFNGVRYRTAGFRVVKPARKNSARN